MEYPCSSPACSKPATIRCVGCKPANNRTSDFALYCSNECQWSHWEAHRETCTSTELHNCFLIRTHPDPNSSALYGIEDHIQPFPLENYGSGLAEAKELRNRLGWRSASEMGTFYDHLGTETWWYFVYGQLTGEEDGKPKNEIASRACGKDIWGDVAVVRHFAVANPAEMFTGRILCETLEWLRIMDSLEEFLDGKEIGAVRSIGFGDTDAGNVRRNTV